MGYSLGGIPPFDELPEEVLTELEKIAVVFSAKRGRQLFIKGQEANGFYILKRGKLKLYTLDTLSGREQILKIAKPVEVFAEAASLSGRGFPVNVEVLEDAEIIFIDRSHLLKLAQKYPQLCLGMSRVLAERLYQLVNLVETLVLSGAIPRLARYLLENAQKGVVEDFRTTLVANQLGLSVETISRALSVLRERNIVEKKKNRVIIRDAEALRRLVGDP